MLRRIHRAASTTNGSHATGIIQAFEGRKEEGLDGSVYKERGRGGGEEIGVSAERATLSQPHLELFAEKTVCVAALSGI
jgi:hypothetical protein